jgi:hypothetical protein
MFWCNARRQDKRGVDFKPLLARLALATGHGDVQLDGMKTNRQGLYLADALALADHVPTLAGRTYWLCNCGETRPIPTPRLQPKRQCFLAF